MDKISLKSFSSKKQPNEWMLEHFKYNIEYENEENIEIDKRSISSKLPNCVFAVIYDKYDLDGNLLATFDSISMASNITDTNKNDIRKVAQGIWKSSGGFIWKFKEDESGV